MTKAKGSPPSDEAGLDTSAEAQEERIESMRARLEAAGVETVSELSELHGKSVRVDGVAGTVCYVHDTEGRLAADLEDGRRVWLEIGALTDDNGTLAYSFGNDAPAAGDGNLGIVDGLANGGAS